MRAIRYIRTDIEIMIIEKIRFEKEEVKFSECMQLIKI